MTLHNGIGWLVWEVSLINHRIGEPRSWQAILPATCTRKQPRGALPVFAGPVTASVKRGRILFSVEVHRLDLRSASSVERVGGDRTLWDQRHNPLRNHVWATHLLAPRNIMAWFEAQAQSIEKSHMVLITARDSATQRCRKSAGRDRRQNSSAAASPHAVGVSCAVLRPIGAQEQRLVALQICSRKLVHVRDKEDGYIVFEEADKSARLPLPPPFR